MKIRKNLFILLFVILLCFLIISATEKGLKIKKIKGNEGKRFAICVGINDYEDENIGDLKKAENDALALGKKLSEKGQFDKVITMVNDFDHFQQKLVPTKSNIEKKLEFLLEFSSPEDLIIFSFSGHGITDNSGEGYLITLDSKIDDKFDTSLKVSDVTKMLQKYKIKKSLLILDACREEMTATKSLKDIKGLTSKEFSESEVAATFYSTKAGWYSYEDDETDFGVFTRFILEGLDGRADKNKDKIVTFTELESFVQQEVNDFSLKNNRKQKPYTKIYGEKYGDLALTTYTEDFYEEDDLDTHKSTKDAKSFKASLQGGKEFDTVLLSWTPPSVNNYDGFIILRQPEKPINIKLKDKLTYSDGEKIKGSDTVVVKVFDKNTFKYIDSGLKEDTKYYYRIFTFQNENNFSYYSHPGNSAEIKTKLDGVNVKINFDSIRVIDVKETSWACELYWTVEVKTSTGKNYTLNKLEQENHWAAMADDVKNFGTKHPLEIELPKKGNSYFEIIIDIRERDDKVKDGWKTERGGIDHIVKKHAIRYYVNDDDIYKVHLFEASHKKAAHVELQWTIQKIEN